MTWFCEHKPYEGAGYWCYLDRGHEDFHSDLTLLWDDSGNFVNADGTKI